MEIDDITRIINTYDKNKIVFWVGSGIDHNRPTCLPLGPELLEGLYDLTLGGTNRTNILNKYQNLHKDIPRLETIVSEIKVYENELKGDVSIIHGFKSFDKAPHNRAHEVLAQYLKSGSNIVTTNYGNAIPLAFNKLYPDSIQFDKAQYDKEYSTYIYSNDDNSTGKIYHIHGVSDDISTIGATLDEVKNSLSLHFKRLIQKWINDGYCFVFLGYSFSDTLDVNVMFNELNETDNLSTAIIVHHSQNEDVPEEIYEKYDVVKGFNTYFQVNTNTMDFINKITFNSKSAISGECKDFKWIDEFFESTHNYHKELFKYIVLGYVKALGIPIFDIVDKSWFDDIDDNSYKLFKSNWYIDYFSFICLANSGNIKAAKRFQSRLDKYNPLVISDIYSKHNKIKKAAKQGSSLEEIFQFLNHFSKENIIDWNISTPLNRKAQWILIDLLKSPITYRYKKHKYNKDAISIIECNNMILEYGNDYVQEFIQIINAWRYNGVLIMIYKNDFSQAENLLLKALYNYREISNIDGMTSTKLYLAYINLLNYYFNKEENSYILCVNYLNEIEQLLQSNHDKEQILIYHFINFYIRSISKIRCIKNSICGFLNN